jgi:hypothetical protein
MIVLALFAGAGCSGPGKGAIPAPPPGAGTAPPADDAARAAAEPIPPAIPVVEEPGSGRTSESPSIAPEPPPAPGVAAEDRENAGEKEKDDAARATGAPVTVSPPPEMTASAKKPKRVPPPEPAAPSRRETAPGPGWAREKEVLVYRVDFIGITMGYARFRYQGKVSIGGRLAYHLSVRAWTSGVLSYIYPINETINYYLDLETLAPIRQEFTGREKQKDDVALYDQETGKIVYRYRHSGEIRKQVETVPGIYDPVSAAYYFRWRDVGGEEKARNVYAGRKVFQISARLLGAERLHTEHGEVDTLVIQPVIRRDGKVENKGDLKMWVSNDERHVPVRLYAKFRKIKDWTLVGELMSERGGRVADGQGSAGDPRVSQMQGRTSPGGR